MGFDAASRTNERQEVLLL